MQLLDLHKFIVQYLHTKKSNQLEQKTNVAQQQTMLENEPFNKQIISKIKEKQFREMYDRAHKGEYVDYNLIQWYKILSSLSIASSALSQNDYKQQFDALRKDPGDIVEYLVKCIADSRNKSHQLSKKQQNEINFILGARYGTNDNNLNHENEKINVRPRGSILKTDQNVMHNEIHNMFVHLSFKRGLSYGYCNECKQNELGEKRPKSRFSEFYCLPCWDAHYKNKPRQEIILKEAHQNIPNIAWKGLHKIAQSIKKDFTKNFHQRLFTKFYILNKLIEKGILTQPECYALLVKHGFDTLFMYSFHILNQLKELKILQLCGWINSKCNDKRSLSFMFQQISLSWEKDFKNFWVKGLHKDENDMTVWRNQFDSKINQHRRDLYGWDFMGFLWFINNTLKHYNTMFYINIKNSDEIEKRYPKLNEYGIYIQILTYFKGTLRLLVKIEQSLLNYIEINKNMIVQKQGQHIIDLSESIKTDLGALYDLIQCVSEDYVGYHLFIYGLKCLKERNHKVFYDKNKEIKKDINFKEANEYLKSGNLNAKNYTVGLPPLFKEDLKCVTSGHSFFVETEKRKGCSFGIPECSYCGGFAYIDLIAYKLKTQNKYKLDINIMMSLRKMTNNQSCPVFFEKLLLFGFCREVIRTLKYREIKQQSWLPIIYSYYPIYQVAEWQVSKKGLLNITLQINCKKTQKTKIKLKNFGILNYQRTNIHRISLLSYGEQIEYLVMGLLRELSTAERIDMVAAQCIMRYVTIQWIYQGGTFKEQYEHARGFFECRNEENDRKEKVMSK